MSVVGICGLVLFMVVLLVVTLGNAGNIAKHEQRIKQLEVKVNNFMQPRKEDDVGHY